VNNRYELDEYYAKHKFGLAVISGATADQFPTPSQFKTQPIQSKTAQIITVTETLKNPYRRKSLLQAYLL